jgi:hypothetical protein
LVLDGKGACSGIGKEVAMPAKAVARTGAARRSMKQKAGAAEQMRTPAEVMARGTDADDWTEPDDDRERLEEGEMEMLLTGHAATHGFEGEDNWLIETEEIHRGER